MTPEQGKFLLDTLLPKIEREQAATAKVLAAVPADKGDYRPSDVGMSAMDLAAHIAGVELRFMEGAVAGKIDFAGMIKPEKVTNPAQVAEWYSKDFPQALEKVRAMTPEQAVTMLDFRGMFQLPAVELLDMMLRHSAHHRGQLTVYLRPMGAKVPSIYGESYDDRLARQAKSA